MEILLLLTNMCMEIVLMLQSRDLNSMSYLTMMDPKNNFEKRENTEQ